MDPIAPLESFMDRTEEFLGHSPHPAIVALPIGAWAVSNVCDVLGLLTGGKQYDDAARLSMAIGLVGAAGAIATGIRDYSFIPRERPSHEIATTHALGNATVGTLFTTSYILRSRDHGCGRRTRLLARLFGLSGGALALYTAWLGGVLVEEQGEAVKPVMEQMGHQEQQGERGSRRDESSWRRERLASGRPLGQH
jgi:uncharacterized membrane protein